MRSGLQSGEGVGTVGSPTTDVWAQIAQRRATNMGHIAAELAASGQLRDDLHPEQAADARSSLVHVLDCRVVERVSRGHRRRKGGSERTRTEDSASPRY